MTRAVLAWCVSCPFVPLKQCTVERIVAWIGLSLGLVCCMNPCRRLHAAHGSLFANCCPAVHSFLAFRVVQTQLAAGSAAEPQESFRVCPCTMQRTRDFQVVEQQAHSSAGQSFHISALKCPAAARARLTKSTVITCCRQQLRGLATECSHQDHQRLCFQVDTLSLTK